MSHQWHGVQKRKVKGRTRYQARLELEDVTITGAPYQDPRNAAKEYDWMRVKNGLNPKNGLVKRTEPNQ